MWLNENLFKQNKESQEIIKKNVDTVRMHQHTKSREKNMSKGSFDIVSKTEILFFRRHLLLPVVKHGFLRSEENALP